MYDLSVIIPVYNVEKYIEECIESIFVQTLKNIEIICIDDNSDDRSKLILKEICETNDNCILIENDNNCGPSITRNKGIEAATGSYIAFLDSDDLFGDLEFLDKALGIMKSQRLDMLGFNLHKFYDGEKFICNTLDVMNVDYNMCMGGQDYFIHLDKIKDYKIEACRYIYNRDFLQTKNIRFYPGILQEDNLFTFNCFMHANRILSLNYDGGYLYRQHSKSIMHTYNIKRRDSILVIIKEILMYVNSNEIDDELFQAIYHFVMFLNESYRRYRCYELECLGDKKWSRSDVVLTHLAMLNEYCYFDKKSLMNIFSASRVYIYGCGLIASDVIYFFKRIGVEIESIIVTDKSFEPDKLYEYEIRELNESVVQNDDVVVLAVKEKYLEEIKNSLKSKQINNYVEIKYSKLIC